jgi:hypothetical protein
LGEHRLAILPGIKHREIYLSLLPFKRKNPFDLAEDYIAYYSAAADFITGGFCPENPRHNASRLR